MRSANHSRLIFVFALVMAGIAVNEAQLGWGRGGGWGDQMGDSSIAFDDDSQVGADSSVGWGSDPFGWNNVDNNNRPLIRPGQNSPGTNPAWARPTPGQNNPPFGTRPDQNNPPFGTRPGQNNPPFGTRPDQNNPPFGTRPNRPTTSAATTARTTAAGARTTTANARTDASSTSSTTPRSNPEQTQCISRCPASPEYNPVCGSNRQNYNNPGRLRCAASCGLNVQIAYYGVCREVGQPQVFPRRDP